MGHLLEHWREHEGFLRREEPLETPAPAHRQRTRPTFPCPMAPPDPGVPPGEARHLVPAMQQPAQIATCRLQAPSGIRIEANAGAVTLGANPVPAPPGHEPEFRNDREYARGRSRGDEQMAPCRTRTPRRRRPRTCRARHDAGRTHQRGSDWAMPFLAGEEPRLPRTFPKFPKFPTFAAGPLRHEGPRGGDDTVFPYMPL